MNPRIAVLLILVPLLAAPATATCVGIEVGAGSLLFADGFESGDTSAWGSPDPRFSATRVLDLELLTRFADDFTGDHLLRLKLLTPKGHHYQTLTVPVATAAEQNARRRVAGFPRPLAVRLADPVAGEGSAPVVAVPLPVAGTAIVTSSLYGRWTVEAFVDDEPAACAAAVFYLHP